MFNEQEIDGILKDVWVQAKQAPYSSTNPRKFQTD